MCIAVCYECNNKVVITNFAQMGAQLPIRKSNHQIITATWGRRVNEKSLLPFGGWASLESIQQGKWEKYFPKFVKLPVIKFQEVDYEGQSLWFDVTSGQWLQGLLIHQPPETRVYVVTLTPAMSNTTFHRWPCVMSE